MSAPRSIRTVESHTEGMPTRVILEGAPEIPGDLMSKRLQWAEQHLNDMREFLMNEPRGSCRHVWRSPDAHHSPRCRSWRSVHERERVPRHVRVWHDRRATVIVEKGLVEVSEPVTVVRLDTPAGLVAAHVRARAWITGTAEFTLDPSDPFPTGFKFGS